MSLVVVRGPRRSLLLHIMSIVFNLVWLVHEYISGIHLVAREAITTLLLVLVHSFIFASTRIVFRVFL